MSYTALYRKFRPDTFENVKGQDAIVQTLKNQIQSGRVGHAYLFCGTRGTGKTTAAKILAKAVNCEHPVDGSPCGECDSCRAVAAGRSMNVIEIDAASNNSVDDVRLIREQTAYSPTEGYYKVFIIDEVHMMSTSAFNALLKTLEEPPAYVIFILATTEPHKLPITILSRCQRYDFKRISISVIADRLTELMKEEGVDVEDRAIRYVAKKADGSMRDAMSLLDQCIAFYLGKKLTYENVLEVLGAVDTEVFSRMLRQILEKDVTALMDTLEQLVMQGRELGQFVTDFTWYLRNLLLLKTSDHVEEDVLEISAEQQRLLEEEAAMVRENALIRYIRIFSELANQLKYETSKRIALEVALIKMCRPQMEGDLLSLQERVREMERRLESGVYVTAPSGGQSGYAADGAAAMANRAAAVQASGNGQAAGDVFGDAAGAAEDPSAEQRPAKPAPEDLKRAVSVWRSVTAEIGGRFGSMLSGAQLRYQDGTDQRLYVIFPDFLGERYTQDDQSRMILENKLVEKTGAAIEVKMLVAEDQQTVGALSDLPAEERIRSKVNFEIEEDDSSEELW
ncbi:MAG: DNA polymerase III subunit gamma/tau [Eubacteriales bacterium]|nr:DNA polymerase III subunit gamma/tau [Eubacteriales bacterium]